MATRICSLLFLAIGSNAQQQLRRHVQDDNSDSNGLLRILLIASFIGFVMAIIVTWACYFVAGRRMEANQSQETSTASEKPKKEKKHSSSGIGIPVDTMSYDSRRPLSTIHMHYPDGTSDAEEAGDDESSIESKQKSISEFTSASILSYMNQVKAAAATLGAGAPMQTSPTIKVKKRKDTETNAGSDGEHSNESFAGFMKQCSTVSEIASTNFQEVEESSSDESSAGFTDSGSHSTSGELEDDANQNTATEQVKDGILFAC